MSFVITSYSIHYTKLYDLAVVEKEFGGLRILRTSVPPKLCTREEVLSFFGKLLEIDLSEGPANLVTRFSGGGKTLLLVDDAQNLFLAALGKFGGYRALLDLINRNNFV